MFIVKTMQRKGCALMKLVVDFIIMMVKFFVIYKLALFTTRVITGRYGIRYIFGKSIRISKKILNITKNIFSKLKGAID